VIYHGRSPQNAVHQIYAGIAQLVEYKYSIGDTLPMKATCLQCNKDFEYGHSSTGKFCSNQCSGLYKKTEHKTKFFSGLLNRIERPTARKYLAEERGYKCEVCSVSDWQGKPKASLLLYT